MSALTGKHILVVGEETPQITATETALITYGAKITTAICQTTDADKILTQQIDLILLNHVDNSSYCRLMLQALQQEDFNRKIPVFAVVKNDQMHIRDVLMHGATDYILEQEDANMIVEKVKLALGDEGTSSGSSAIDITPAVTTHEPGTRVFVAEDDPLLSNLLAVRFERSELAFQIVPDGTDILQKIEAFQPQVIILDIMLPGKDGISILEDIKNSHLKDIPVIIFSNKDEPSTRQRASELGAAGFYVKAMTDLSALMNVIESLAR